MKIGIDPEDLAGVEGLEDVKVREQSDLYISVGIGNRKIGLIPSWSLPPVVTCNPRAAKFCAETCYTKKIRELYPNVWEAWQHNYRMWCDHPVLTELLIRKFLAMAMPHLMRLHVGGDFVSKAYLEMWKNIARDHPSCVFYGYSKVDGLDHATLPSNLRILRSQWPGMPPPRQKHVYRNCWMQDGTEKRIPKTYELCCGDCPKCGFKCAFGNTDIVINRHN